MSEDKGPIKPSKTLGEHLRKSLAASHRRRPMSFYFLLAIPIVLLLGLRIGDFQDQPERFALVLTLMFVFFGIIVLRAVIDVLEISRRHLREQNETWRETLGEEGFVNKLGNRADDEHGK